MSAKVQDPKNSQSKERRRVVAQQQARSGPDLLSTIGQQTDSINEMPTDLSARPLRQAAVLQMQRQQGNGYVSRQLIPVLTSLGGQYGVAERNQPQLSEMVQRQFDLDAAVDAAAGAVDHAAQSVAQGGNPFAPPDAGTSSHPLLRFNSQGAAVEELQQKLNDDGATPSLTVDGIFGPLTKAAVVAFQIKYGLAPDGIVGPLTWGKMDELGLRSNVGRVERDWSELVGGQTYGMTSRYTWRILDGEIRITVRLRFTGLDRPALIQSWFTGIRNTWNHFDAVNQETGERLAIVFEPQSVTGSEDNSVEIMAGNGRANAAQWYEDDPDGDQTAAHEFGHMIGLEDEYQRTHDDYTRLTGEEPAEGETENDAAAEDVAEALHDALRVADEADRVAQANQVITDNQLVQGAYAQQVAGAYQTAYGVEIVSDIVARIPDEEEWSIVDPFTYSSGSIMGIMNDHDHPVAARHVNEFVGYVQSSQGGQWQAETR